MKFPKISLSNFPHTDKPKLLVFCRHTHVSKSDPAHNISRETGRGNAQDIGNTTNCSSCYREKQCFKAQTPESCTALRNVLGCSATCL